MISEFNFDYLNFSNFFTYEDCASEETLEKYALKKASLIHSGGRMLSFKNGKILFTIGYLGDYHAAQDKNSMFGKIISVDLKTIDFEIVAMGSRNAQGLYYDKNKNIIVHTEHGPKGGDEININLNPDNKTIENYGWPISSYGEAQLKETWLKKQTLHKSHKDYGFLEPIKYFVPSIAISQIIKIPTNFNKRFTNDFFIGALGFKSQINEGDQSIHHIRFNENFDQIVFEDIIPIGERIRDIIFVQETNTVLMILETIPAIG
jgi:glucose/arabinose dehydrogenase